jgi:hypothetical protein
MHVASLGKASITASKSRNKTNQGIFHELEKDFLNHHRFSVTLEDPYFFIILIHLTLRTDAFLSLLFPASGERHGRR